MDEGLPAWMDGVPFSIREGRTAGLSDARMRRVAFERPFHGVRLSGRSGRIDDGLVDRCTALRVVLPRDALFCVVTAARLWRMPFPPGLSDELHVLVPDGAEVRRPGIVGWRRAGAMRGTVHLGVPVTTPADTWAMLAAMNASRGGLVTPEWLVAIGDFLVSGRRKRFGREPALATLEELADAVRRHGSRRGAVALRWALDRVRRPVDSPPETFVRLELVGAGLPEPVTQPPVRTAEGIRHPDLAYLAERVLLEYLGDVHRTDRATWLEDLHRIRLFEDAGFRVVLLGGRDLTPAGRAALATRVRGLLTA